METKEQLQLEQSALRKRIKEISTLIYKSEYDEQLAEKQALVGKCYKEKETSNLDYHRYYYVYAVDPTENRVNLKVLEISYYENQDTFFFCEYHSTFGWGENGFDEYTLVEKEEFLKHYNAVQDIIKKSVSAIIK